MTNRQLILRTLHHCNFLSATQVAHRVNSSPAIISSLLVRMCREGVLSRIPGLGPRGGHVYRIIES